jgi:hypothetical protein
MASSPIKGSVGTGGDNRQSDVITVQLLLLTQIAFRRPKGVQMPVATGTKEGRDGGTVDEKTIQAIQWFQRDVVKLSKPDGLVEVGKRTIKALVRPIPKKFVAEAKGERLVYDGHALKWMNPGDGQSAASYKATSGLPEHQKTIDQCLKDQGPIPEGKYKFRLIIDPKKYARDDGTGRCNLRSSSQIQKIPRGARAGDCEEYWANWGRNRVRIDAADKKTRGACKPRRGGFYIHDSHKGYSHGCIEVEASFFDRLYKYAKKSPGRTIYVYVDYAYNDTYGGTKK